MEFEPDVAFVLPLLEQLFRKRVSQAECNEVNRSTLLPMRQTIVCKVDVSMRIEELHRSGGIIPPFLPT